MLQRKVKTQAGGAMVARESPHALVGWRVNVYWPGEDGEAGSDGWYTGQVTDFAQRRADGGVDDENAGKHKGWPAAARTARPPLPCDALLNAACSMLRVSQVVYDDGSSEYVDLTTEQYKLVRGSTDVCGVA